MKMKGMKEKPRKKKKRTKEEPAWLLSHPPVYNMEADCFSPSESTENKPDLS